MKLHEDVLGIESPIVVRSYNFIKMLLSSVLPWIENVCMLDAAITFRQERDSIDVPLSRALNRQYVQKTLRNAVLCMVSLCSLLMRLRSCS